MSSVVLGRCSEEKRDVQVKYSPEFSHPSSTPRGPNVAPDDEFFGEPSSSLSVPGSVLVYSSVEDCHRVPTVPDPVCFSV